MVLCRVNGFQESSLRSGRNLMPKQTSTFLGLFVMVQSMLSGLRILTQYLMTTKFLLLLTMRESQCLITLRWCLRLRTLITPPQLLYQDAELFSYLQLIFSGDHSSEPGAEIEQRKRPYLTQMKTNGVRNSQRNTSLKLIYIFSLTEIITT